MTQTTGHDWVSLRLPRQALLSLKPTEALALLVLAASATCDGEIVPTTYQRLTTHPARPALHLKPSTLRHATTSLQDQGFLFRRRSLVGGASAVGFDLHYFSRSPIQMADQAPAASPSVASPSGRDSAVASPPGRYVASPSGRKGRPVADATTTRGKNPNQETNQESPLSGGGLLVVGGQLPAAQPAALTPPDGEVELALQDAATTLGHELTDPVRKTLRSVLRQPHIPPERRREAAIDIAGSFAADKGRYSDNAAYWGDRLLAWSPSTRPKRVTGAAAVEAVFARHGVVAAPGIDEEMRRVALR